MVRPNVVVTMAVLVPDLAQAVVDTTETARTVT